MSRKGTPGNWAKGVIGNRAARIAVLVVALLFAGGFWLLQNTGVIEPSETVAIVGVALFVLVAFPVALLTGRSSDKALNREK
ncbi:hypothetical protein [Nesterenkonia sandarakina]|uniref:Uncharacterized protein n=1 Tax=Nesterenkonia sandarakina TaxID=272918 RepID=A0A7Z0J4I9_9MICC|nr:hypothetical protein [Nesterenkonia sandarakina]NYJ18126.1 hypothetical protein [Nesterenkonia sandarakina]